jgi:hypothetical protein
MRCFEGMRTRSFSAPSGLFALAVLLTLGCGGTVKEKDPLLLMGSSGAGSGGKGKVSPSGGASTGATKTDPSGGSETGGTGEGGAEAGGAEPGGAAGLGGVSGGSGGASGGGAPGRDPREVWKSDGCGKAYNGPSGNTPITLQTMGEKDANCAAHLANGTKRCGLWGQAGSTWQTEPVPRDHYIYLPEGYDPSAPYSLVLLGPGCGGNGTSIYDYGNNVDGTAIRVGVTPAPTYVGHGTNPEQGCFDDKEGDDSVDWVQFEMMYDQLNEVLCFDRNRVFAGGNSSGSWWANELGCKYAGDGSRPIRGITPNGGTLSTEPAHVPTCTNAPMAGLWVWEVNDGGAGFSTTPRVAIDRAMAHNDCMFSTSYDNAMFEDFPIGGGQPNNTCKRILNCDPLYPLVTCPLPGNGHGSHIEVVNPGASTFIKLFSQGAFVAP